MNNFLWRFLKNLGFMIVCASIGALFGVFVILAFFIIVTFGDYLLGDYGVPLFEVAFALLASVLVYTLLEHKQSE